MSGGICLPVGAVTVVGKLLDIMSVQTARTITVAVSMSTVCPAV